MRWFAFGILAAVLLTLQSSVAPWLEVFGARPDWLLVAVVFLGLYARGRDAIIASWVIGACADLMTIERFGLLAVSYTLAAILVTVAREYLLRYRPRTQFVVTLVVCLLLQTAWLVYRRASYGPVGSIVVEWVGRPVLTAVYTACWAPPVHWILLNMSRLLGIVHPRYRYSGMRATSGADV